MELDDNKQKIIFYIIFFLIILVSLSIILKSTSIFNNQSKDLDTNYAISNNYEDINKTQPITSNNSYNTEDKKVSFFYSNDGKFYLILTNNFRAYSNPDMGTQDKRFLMNIDTFYSTDSFTGRYEIKNDRLYLYIETGCLDKDNNFSCVIPDNIQIDKKEDINVMSLPLNDNEIKFGTISLIEQS